MPSIFPILPVRPARLRRSLAALALSVAGLQAPVALASDEPVGRVTGTAPEARTADTAAATANRQILLELGRRRISLLENGKVMGSWPVAIGDPATPTPTGTFQVQNMVINPQYQSTKSGKINATVGPNGPLGDRWIGFLNQGKNQFGIHGTPAAWAWAVQQGAAVTHGCVRMLGDHVRFLFDRVSLGTPVVVRK
ncbi:MAG: L,D-transpeptidase [Synechococcaceae cyanobacterium]|nr:L,D-transpeptidase [Synechococcaceae cyanobacterium]